MCPEPAAGPLGILGGTFDPIHFAHLRLAEEAREALQLERVRLIPAGQPPHRGTPRSTAEDRLAMAKLAIAGNPAFEIDDGEGNCVAPSEATALDGSYRPLSRPLFVYTSESMLEEQEIRGFLKFYLEQSVNLVPEVGYAPLPAEVLAEQLAKLSM